MLKLTRNRYWHELEDLSMEGELPRELMFLLRDLFSPVAQKQTMPEASPHLIKLAKAYLRDGIMLDEDLYGLMVCEPENGNANKNQRTFFVVVPKWPGAELKRLNEY